MVKRKWLEPDCRSRAWHPGLILCAGQGFAEVITTTTTYEVREINLATGLSAQVGMAQSVESYYSGGNDDFASFTKRRSWWSLCRGEGRRACHGMERPVIAS